MKKEIIIELLIIASLLLIGSIFFINSDLDLKLEKNFYSSESGWLYKDTQPWKFIYHYSNIPALIISIGSLFLFALSFNKERLLKYRKIFIYLTLVMLIGPGLLVNAGFKDHWGRPRPRHVVEFSGNEEFLEFWQPSDAGKGKSFPCGHATMGFYFFALYFLFREKNKKLSIGFLIFSILYGGLIGLTRMIQGGHFASDVLWAAGMVYITAMLLYYTLNMHKSILIENHKKKFKVRKWVIYISIPIGIAGIFFFLIASPYYKKDSFKKTLGNNTKYHQINFTFDHANINIFEGDSIQIDIKAQAFGIPGRKLKDNYKVITSNDTTLIYFDQKKQGIFSELNNNVSLYLSFKKDIVYYIRATEGNIELSLPNGIDSLNFEPDTKPILKYPIKFSNSATENAKFVLSAPKGKIIIDK